MRCEIIALRGPPAVCLARSIIEQEPVSCSVENIAGEFLFLEPDTQRDREPDEECGVPLIYNDMERLDIAETFRLCSVVVITSELVFAVHSGCWFN